MLALRSLLAEPATAKPDPLGPKSPHHAARAKRVIFLWMQGGPSQVDLFDHKPLLTPGVTGEEIPIRAAIEPLDARRSLLEVDGLDREVCSGGPIGASPFPISCPT